MGRVEVSDAVAKQLMHLETALVITEIAAFTLIKTLIAAYTRMGSRSIFSDRLGFLKTTQVTSITS